MDVNEQPDEETQGEVQEEHRNFRLQHMDEFLFSNLEALWTRPILLGFYESLIT